MSTTTPVNGFQIPVLSDAPDIETAIHPFANAVDTRVVSRHASSAARATAIPSPIAGAVSYLTDTGNLEFYDGAAWLPVSGGWNSYTPTFTSSGGGATVGNGTLVGKWRRSFDAVDVYISLVLGSTTSFGTGYIQFSLPVTAANLSPSGSATLQDNGVNTFAASCHTESTTVITPVSASGVVTATSPFTWVAGDIVRLSITVEI